MGVKTVEPEPAGGHLTAAIEELRSIDAALAADLEEALAASRRLEDRLGVRSAPCEEFVDLARADAATATSCCTSSPLPGGAAAWRSSRPNASS
ncbi:hypothetical protein [Micromonospora sp. DT47]|uniref:hypothetical protein n=1 Tax=Micromonospora sp. DT47 TaxID=3393431 RepID=UPI003CF8C9C4